MFTQKNIDELTQDTKDRIIRAAWEDDVSFESIQIQFGISEPEVIRLMKKIMTPSMFIVWRKRVRGRIEKYNHKIQMSLSNTI